MHPYMIGKIVFMYKKINKKDKEEKKQKQTKKRRKTMYSKQLYTVAILTPNKSIQAVRLIY